MEASVPDKLRTDAKRVAVTHVGSTVVNGNNATRMLAEAAGAANVHFYTRLKIAD